MKYCNLCKKNKNLKFFNNHKRHKDGKETQCKECRIKKKYEWLKNNPWYLKSCNTKIKLQVFNHYGTCVCCEEKDIRLLTLDHINNDGNEHRKKINRSGISFYRWVIRNSFPSYLQSMCWNCNCGKYINKGICPHQDKKNNYLIDMI